MYTTNETNKNTIKNGAWLYFLQFFNTILPLVTVPYITRLLGPSNYGVFSFAFSIVGYIQVVIEYGFGMSATRKIAIDEGGYDEDLSILFSAVIYSRVLLWVLSTIALLVYCVLDRNQSLLILCIWILHIGMIGYCFQHNWLFQGKQKMKYISIVNVSARVLSVTLIFVFVKTSKDVLLYSVLYSLTPVVAGLIGTAIAVWGFHVRLKRIRFLRIKEELKSGWNVFCTQFNAKVFSNIGVTFLGLMYSSYEVGVFSAIHKIPNILFLCWSPISQVMYPIFSRMVTESYDLGKRSVLRARRVVLILFSCLVFGVMISARFLANILFGEEYGNYYYLCLPLLLWVLVGINNNFWGIQLLLGGGYDKEYRRSFNISVICTIVINLICVYAFGMMGAAMAPLLSEILLSMLLLISIRHIEGKRMRFME